ncbi:MAG: cupin domain-containing protein [bacterium]
MTAEEPASRPPLFLLPGEGRWVSSGPGGRTTFKATGAETESRFGLFESVQPAHSRGPELHLHRRMTEMFWVLEGTIHIEAGGQAIDAPAGSFALVPPGTLHRFNNPLDVPSRMLIMFSPGDDREKYFEGLAEFAARSNPPSREEVLDLMHRYDQFVPGD